jgi:hypothetical protein
MQGPPYTQTLRNTRQQKCPSHYGQARTTHGPTTETGVMQLTLLQRSDTSNHGPHFQNKGAPPVGDVPPLKWTKTPAHYV